MTTDSPKSNGLDSAENPCPMCGSSNFTWGIAQIIPIEPSHSHLVFAYGEAIGKSDGEFLEARRCNQCGNVLFFATGQ